MITLEDVKNNQEIKELIRSSQVQLDALGYTEPFYKTYYNCI